VAREINSPDEIVRRLLYVVYLGLVVVALVAGVLGVAQHRLDYLGLMLLAGVTALVFRAYGRRRFDFVRLANSFPYGSRDEFDLPAELLAAVEELLAAGAGCGNDWIRRQELRGQLRTLLRDEPGLWRLYGREIETVFPALAALVGDPDTEADPGP